MSKPRGTNVRWLPWQPLRDALLRAAALDGFGPRCREWQETYGCHRLWFRCERQGRITEAQADELCCRVLRVHPWTIYGDAWETLEALPDPEPQPDVRHGSVWGYNRGCRCEQCAEAMREYQRMNRRRRKERADAA